MTWAVIVAVIAVGGYRGLQTRPCSATIEPPARLGGRDLSGRDLTGDDLHGADLSSANLTGTRLDGVDLGAGDLDGAMLRGASLTGASLRAVALDSATLQGAVGLSDAMLASALSVDRLDLATTLSDKGLFLQPEPETASTAGAACDGTPLPTAAVVAEQRFDGPAPESCPATAVSSVYRLGGGLDLGAVEAGIAGMVAATGV